MNPAGQMGGLGMGGPAGMMGGPAAVQGANAPNTQLQQMLFQTLRQAQTRPLFPWHSELNINERAKVIMQISSSLRLVQEGMDQPKALKMAQAFENQTWEKSPSKDDYFGACRAKMQQIQDTRKRQVSQKEHTLRDQQYLQQQQQQQQQRPGPNLQAHLAQQQAAQNQQLLTGGVAGMAGLPMQNFNMLNPQLQQQLQQMAAMKGQQGMLTPQQQLALQQQQQQQQQIALAPYRNMNREQAVIHLAKTMMAQAQAGHIANITAQVEGFSDEQKRQCLALGITPTEMFFRNAAAKKLAQSGEQLNNQNPTMPLGRGAAPQLNQQQQQQIQAQQLQQRQQQVQRGQQILANSGLGRGQPAGQPNQGFDFMTDMQSYLSQQQHDAMNLQNNGVQVVPANKQQQQPARPGQPMPGFPGGMMPGQTTPQMNPQAQQQILLMQRQLQQQQQQAAAAAGAQPGQQLIGQQSPQLNGSNALLTQSHRPGQPGQPGQPHPQMNQANQQAAQATQAQLNSIRLAEVQARRLQQQQAAVAAGAGVPGQPLNFPAAFKNLPPEQQQVLIARLKQQQAAQQSQNPALLQQQQAVLDAQNRLRAGNSNNPLPTPPAQQVNAMAQNPLLQNLGGAGGQPMTPQLSADLAKRLQLQQQLNMQQQQKQLSQQLQNQSSQAQSAQQAQQAQSQQQSNQQNQQQQSVQPGQPQPQRAQVPNVPDVPFPAVFEDMRLPPTVVTLIAKFLPPGVEIPPTAMQTWKTLKEWVKAQNAVEIGQRIRQIHFMQIQEMSKRFTGEMATTFQRFLQNLRQTHAVQQQQQQQQQQLQQQQQQNKTSPPKPPVSKPGPPGQISIPPSNLNQAAGAAPKPPQPAQQPPQQGAPTAAMAKNLKRRAEEAPKAPEPAQAPKPDPQNAQNQQAKSASDWNNFLQKLLQMPEEMQRQVLARPQFRAIPEDRKLQIQRVLLISKQQRAQAQAQNSNQQNAAQVPPNGNSAPVAQQQQQQQQQPQRPPSANQIQQQQQQQKPQEPTAAAAAQQGPSVAVDVARQQANLLKNKDRYTIIKQEETNTALRRSIIPMSDDVKTVVRNSLLECSQLLMRMEQWIPLFLMISPNEGSTRELLRQRALIATQFQDQKSENGKDQKFFVTPKDNFTITPDELEMARGSISKYFNYVKSQIPKLNEQRAKQGQSLIPFHATPASSNAQVGPSGNAVANQAMAQQQQLHLLQQIAANKMQQSQSQQGENQQRPQSEVNPLQQQQQAAFLQQQQNQKKQQAAQQQQQQSAAANQKLNAAPPAPTPSAPVQASNLKDFNLTLPQRKKFKASPPAESPTIPMRTPDALKKDQPKVTPDGKSVAKPAPIEGAFKCKLPKCQYHTKGFPTQQDLLRHLQVDHKEDLAKHYRQEAAKHQKVEVPEPVISNPLEYTLSAVADALGLNRDGTRKAKEGEKKDQVAKEKDVKPQTPQTKGSPPGPSIMRTPSKSSTMQPSASQSGHKPSISIDIKDAPPLDQITIRTPIFNWEDSMISPTTIHQAFEGLEDITELAIDSIDPSMIMTPDDSDDMFDDIDEVKLPGTPPAGILGDKDTSSGAQKAEIYGMNETEMKDFDSWNPYGIRNNGPIGVLDDIDWEVVDFDGGMSSSENSLSMSGWDTSLFQLCT